ncbi:MAG: helix-turn-helix domain-containing protein [Lachnospiraceae bacterium]|nr:helix-turn-helix domain-containing protein [Lachnospiraceae bacterium]
MEMTEILMNPVRQRIFQYLLIHEKGTVKEMKTELSDIPNASLYRHIKILTDHSVITVVEENRIRGTVESVYQLNKGALEVDDADGAGIQMALLGICSAFAKYFSNGQANPRKDMYMMTSCTLTLTDDEFVSFLAELNEVATKYMSKPVTKKSVSRQISLVSSPVNS